MAPKKEKKAEPEPEQKLSRGDVDELIDDGTALVEERDWAPALAKLEAAAEGLEGFEEHMVMSRLCSKIGQCQLELRDVNGALRTFEKQLSSAVLKSTSVSGAPDNSSRSHFSAMTWPRWLRRAVRNRHRHAIEQVSRRWRGGRRDDAARTRRKFDFHTGRVRPLKRTKAYERRARPRPTPIWPTRKRC